jgi:DNA-binding HxlR family transcriptional regulator
MTDAGALLGQPGGPPSLRGTLMKPREIVLPTQARIMNDIIPLVGDKWSVLVIVFLGGRRRFTDIRHSVEGISQRMLTVTLRRLERDGHVTRTVHPTIPPKVEYELTELGRDLLVPLRALGCWALANHARVADARTAYDSRHRRGDAG